MSTVLLLLVGFVVGAIVAAALMSRRSSESATQPGLESGEVPQMLDLLRRANGAQAACLVAPEADPAWAADAPPDPSVLESTESLARLALGDAGDHKMSEHGLVRLAAGDGSLGCALVMEEGVQELALERAKSDLRRFLAGIRERHMRESGSFRAPRDLPEWLTGGPENVEGIAFQLCEAVRSVSGRPAALVLRDPGTKEVSVAAVSAGADRRLLGTAVLSSSAAGRAGSGDVPVAGRTLGELLGERKNDRRSREQFGVAFPVRDGREGVGSLVVFGQPDTIPDRVTSHITWLVANAGPKLGRAATVRAAETRATTDELTGLPNRRALERALTTHGTAPGSMLCVDLDHFKRLNDGFGHAAGDAALRHLAAIFRRELREEDLPCRIGGEEFALWLPGAPPDRASEVADRILRAVRGSLLEWSGAEIQMTCSIGVAAVPETVSDVRNLLQAADKALYRAKDQGRDRVVVAEST